MPKNANIHIDAPLSNYARGYGDNKYIATEILPILPVQNESDVYWIYNQEEIEETTALRAIGTPLRQIDFDYTTGSYQCEEYGHKVLIPDRKARNADKGINLKMDAVRKIIGKVNLTLEKQVKDLVTGGTISGTVPSVKWDATDATPTIEANIDTAKQTVLINILEEANIAMINDQVRDVLKKDSTIRNLMRYTVNENKGKELVVDRNGGLPPVLWGLKVIVATAIENTAKKGQTASRSRVWPDDVLVAYINPAPVLGSASLGFTFQSKPYSVKRWYDDDLEGEYIAGSQILDTVVTQGSAGYLLDNVLG
jgi:hypothetical protein